MVLYNKINKWQTLKIVKKFEIRRRYQSKSVGFLKTEIERRRRNFRVVYYVEMGMKKRQGKWVWKLEEGEGS